MKSYLHGMLTGGLIVFSFMFLMGNKKKSRKTVSKTTRAKFIEIEDRLGMLEGSVNDRFKMVGENFIYLRDKFSISVNTDYNYKSTSLIQNPLPYKMNKKFFKGWVLYLFFNHIKYFAFFKSQCLL